MAKEISHIYNVGDVVGNLEIAQQLRSPRQNGKRISMHKAYAYKCLECSHDGTKAETTIKNNHGCPCCDNKVIIPHVNSIVAKEETHWMVDYFQGGYDEAKLYSYSSDKKVYFKCPDCGTIKDKPMSISSLYRRKGISCICSDSISYPEKVGIVIFHLMDNDCVYQYKPTWGQGKIYDFYLPNYNMIIELHGEQHYNPRGYMIDTPIKENDIFKKKLAKFNGVEFYHEVDCRYSSFNWIVENILKIKELDFSKINMKKVFENAEKNMVKEVCNYKKLNSKVTTKELCDTFCLSSYAIHTYLRKGSELGWCDYDLQENNREKKSMLFKTKNPNPPKRVLVLKDEEIVGEYDSLAQCVEMSQHDFGVKFSQSHISHVCNKLRKTHKGYTFKYK